MTPCRHLTVRWEEKLLSDKKAPFQAGPGVWAGPLCTVTLPQCQRHRRGGLQRLPPPPKGPALKLGRGLLWEPDCGLQAPLTLPGLVPPPPRGESVSGQRGDQGRLVKFGAGVEAGRELNRAPADVLGRGPEKLFVQPPELFGREVEGESLLCLSAQPLGLTPHTNQARGASLSPTSPPHPPHWAARSSLNPLQVQSCQGGKGGLTLPSLLQNPCSQCHLPHTHPASVEGNNNDDQPLGFTQHFPGAWHAIMGLFVLCYHPRFTNGKWRLREGKRPV